MWASTTDGPRPTRWEHGWRSGSVSYTHLVALVKREHEKAVKLLNDHRSKLDELSQYLYEKETITGEEFMKILNLEKAQTGYNLSN